MVMSEIAWRLWSDICGVVGIVAVILFVIALIMCVLGESSERRQRRRVDEARREVERMRRKQAKT